MIDLHIHILPGIDDGARSVAEAVEMCQRAAADGCRALVATPHQRHPRWDNQDHGRLEELLRTVAGRLAGVPDLHLGGEIRVDSELLGELEALGRSGLASLAGSRYLLVELDRNGHGPDPVSLVHELRVAGWVPVLAHPELIPSLSVDLALLRRLRRMGACTQITAMSLIGGFGRRPRRISEKLLDRGDVDFVASDAHGAEIRPPGLSQARNVIAKRWGAGTAERLTLTNPRAVLENRELER